ncbi:hypothetical protein [Deinococcus aquaticus]|uniref:hypothetical protein n=1 Tax=Deinococcus aquaticus TaxID=328692 RepID=UPI003F47E24E
MYHARKAQKGTDLGSPRTPSDLREPHLHGDWTGPGRTRYEVRFLDFIPVYMDGEGPEAPGRLA